MVVPAFLPVQITPTQPNPAENLLPVCSLYVVLHNTSSQMNFKNWVTHLINEVEGNMPLYLRSMLTLALVIRILIRSDLDLTTSPFVSWRASAMHVTRSEVAGIGKKKQARQIEILLR